MEPSDEKLRSFLIEIQRGLFHHPKAIERIALRDYIQRKFETLRDYYTYTPEQLQRADTEVKQFVDMVDWPIFGGIVPVSIVNWVDQGLTAPQIVDAFYESLSAETNKVMDLILRIEEANTPAHLSWAEYRDELFRRKNGQF